MSRILAGETTKYIGKQVLLKGWVNSIRSHGKITFFDLRDRTGLVQIVTNQKINLKPESSLSVTGVVAARPVELVNPKISSGTIEIQASEINILNQSKELPFPIDTDGHDIDEDLRLKYRYIDLRRPRLQANIQLRSHYVQAIREYLFEKEFTEIETPLLTKSTPEGSRDFVVPSRHYPGKFYALPQSPQQYKQLLMVGGFENYFQIARCLRDEDPRADRAYEHTQVDLEMSFVEQTDVMRTVEGMIIHGLEKVGFGDKILSKPFPIISYEEAQAKYGSDKFDLRSDREKQENMLAFAWVTKFPFFEKTEEGDWTFTHNPFSAPVPEHESWHLDHKNIEQIITQQYDLVCNGYEVGGGSIRAHKPEVLRSTFQIMGYSDQEIDEKFGHMLDAFSYGAPPHGGCAHGVERMIMILQQEPYIREVQAFPQTGRGRTSIMDAPSELDPAQLVELKLELTTHKKRTGDQIYTEILNLLKLNHCHDIQTYEHQVVLTSEQAAQVRGTTIDQGAKALVMYGDNKPMIVVLSASTSADTGALKRWLKIRDLRMAKPEEVEALTNLKVGSIPPFGSLFGLPTYVDTKLGNNAEIAFNAGLHTKSLKIKYSDWVKVEQPIVGSFSK